MPTAASVGLTVDGAVKYRALSKRLRDAGADGKGVRRELNKAIREAGKPALRDVKAKVTTLPVKGVRGSGRRDRYEHATRNVRTDRGKTAAFRRSGLRQSIAAATKVAITAQGIRITVDGRKLPPDQRNLPRALDSKKGWRHPLFGRKDRWYAQKAQPWFWTTLIKHAPDFRKKLDEALDRLARQIDKGAG